MVPNPYAASQIETAPLPSERRQEKQFGLYETICLCVLGALVLVAIGHRLQLGDIEEPQPASIEIYRRSPLILIEFLGLLAALAIMLLTIPRCIYLAVNARWLRLVWNVVLGCLAFAAMSAAMQIDAPTLIYAT